MTNNTKTLRAVALIVVLACAGGLLLLGKGAWPLVLLMMLAMLFVSMVAKWNQLSEERPITAKVSLATHIVAMLLVLGLMVQSIFLS